VAAILPEAGQRDFPDGGRRHLTRLPLPKYFPVMARVSGRSLSSQPQTRERGNVKEWQWRTVRRGARR
jgi:hypothetical protein